MFISRSVMWAWDKACRSILWNPRLLIRVIGGLWPDDSAANPLALQARFRSGLWLMEAQGKSDRFPVNLDRTRRNPPSPNARVEDDPWHPTRSILWNLNGSWNRQTHQSHHNPNCRHHPYFDKSDSRPHSICPYCEQKFTTSTLARTPTPFFGQEGFLLGYFGSIRPDFQNLS
jgi:hypothetical protein